MQQFAFFAKLLHPGLRPADAAEPLAPLAAARTDRARLALLLEGAALLAHLDHAGLRLAAGWDGAGLDGDGHLAVPPPHPGRAAELPQVELADLLARLFRIDGRRRLAGRGEARRAVRAVQRRCRQGLIALPPDLLVAQLLDEAPFLFEPPFAATRRRLAGRHRRDGEERPWVAGPGPFRWRLLAAAGDDAEALGDLLASPRAAELHRGAPPAEGTTAGELAAAGRWRAAVAAWEIRPPADAGERRACATAWLGLGRGRRALAALGDDRRDPAALPVVAAALLQLGRLRALLHADRGADLERLDPDDRLAVDAAVVRALANGGDAAAARERALAAVEREARAPLARRAHAHLVAAQAAWDCGDEAATADHLSRAAPLADDPALAPALSQTRALAALAAGRPRRAGEEIAGALARHRRRLPRATAAGLWNDLGLARALAGDLAGAEKALHRALALYRGCDGPRVSTVALANLAEVRLRRGRLAGVEEMLERVAAANRAAGNRRGSASDLVGWGRCELAHGRAAAALALLRRATDRAEGLGLGEVTTEARLLAARALGWLGRAEEAAAVLDEMDASGEPGDAGALAAVEAEERPALFALAGRRDEALRAAAGTPAAELWQAALAGDEPPRSAWVALDAVGPYRAARTVVDLDAFLLAAGGVGIPAGVPGHRRRRAAGELRRCGAVALARRLEAVEEGPWQSLADFLSSAHARPLGEDGPPPVAPLFAAAGYPEARLWWESEEDARVLVDGPGGGEELTAPCGSGRLVLRAPRLDAPLAAFLQVARTQAAALLGGGNGHPGGESGYRARAAARGSARRAAAGVVGDDPGLRAAVDRAGALAGGDLPVLVLGESGTGKELVARLVHRASMRRDRPLVPVNCAALSETLVLSDLFGHVRGAFTGAERDRAGVFETAEGGTVFLDEIGDLPAVAQGMLLRVLQEGEVRRVGESLARKVDVRLVAATHRELGEMVHDGSFRRDLYYRLKGAAVELPPLRERGRDVLLLAEHLLADAHRRGGGEGAVPELSEEARARLLGHDWPGNVRELENVLAVAAALASADGGAIRAEHLELPQVKGESGPAGYHQQVEAYRRRLVVEALRAGEGSQAEAARRLGLSRQALSYLVRTLEIDV